MYKINGTTLSTQPTEGKWVDREPIGTDGNGRYVYPGIREFELKFNLSSQSDVYQLQTFFEAVGATGTVSVDLPEYGASSYAFRTYSGCILSEPARGAYFEEHTNDFKLLISKIRTQ